MDNDKRRRERKIKTRRLMEQRGRGRVETLHPSQFGFQIKPPTPVTRSRLLFFIITFIAGGVGVSDRSDGGPVKPVLM